MKRKVEIFTAGCPMCDPVVKLVNELGCESCDITIYDMVKLCDDKSCLNKAREYGVTKVPAVVVDSKLLSCCQSSSITKEDLVNAGVGQE